jgi:hypothetical protein
MSEFIYSCMNTLCGTVTFLNLCQSLHFLAELLFTSIVHECCVAMYVSSMTFRQEITGLNE